ncbi:MAG: bifunctional demethylmenaquinone methyltransferase/2-methoxy-6-polyprenyl-1,4-benzoquinol methylase UbiE [Thiotrichales bacterium]|nr:MAG: bifunctional demethylmenaquinone methyltransferase/2-methoxy-6-polyprenyl-1,4-benzoquinol methylase UbiE [Thiotrichales bacterium]
MEKDKISKDKSTHFGYQKVDWSEKQHKVNMVFDSVSPKYDLMNDVMSLGLHRIWKKHAAFISNIKPNSRILDLASGTCDFSLKLAKRLNSEGMLVTSDININMLQQGRSRLQDAGYLNTTQIIANAEDLPFPDNYFDHISIAFGLRNVRDKGKAIANMYRVLKPGGKILILEFSKPAKCITKLYDAYSFKIIPILGKLVCNDEDSYRYLVESIRKHPDQEQLKSMLEENAFENCKYLNLCFGVVAIHTGHKF